MYRVEKLNCETGKKYRETIIRFIFESVKNSVFEESYLIADAEAKYEDMMEYILAEKAVVLGAIEGQKLGGIVWGYTYPFRDDKLRMYISILHVDESLRGQKIGKSLVEQMEEEAKKMGNQSIFLHTEAFNDRALKFYKRMGFQPERIQLVKKTSSIKEDEIFEWGGVKRISAEEAKKNYEKLIKLFTINTKAHVLTGTFDQQWVSEKITELIEYISKEQALVLGYFEKKELEGFIWVFPYKFHREERNNLNAITVFPKFRKKHIAQKLFQGMEYELRNDNRAIYTFVDAANEGGYKFYLKQGMVEEVYQLMKKIC